MALHQLTYLYQFRLICTYVISQFFVGETNCSGLDYFVLMSAVCYKFEVHGAVFWLVCMYVFVWFVSDDALEYFVLLYILFVFFALEDDVTFMFFVV